MSLKRIQISIEKREEGQPDLEASMSVDASVIARFLLTAIGEDIDREGLKETPERMMKSWQHLFKGYDEDPEKILKRFENPIIEDATENEEREFDEMIWLRNIEFYSTCEHHFLPFFGRVHVAYIPGTEIFGISKIARLVECFARRLQIQERLAAQIADALHAAGVNGVGVVIEAKHLCMTARGIEKQHSSMVTSALRGAIKEKPEARAEFLSMIEIGGD